MVARQLGQEGARIVLGARDRGELDRSWRDLQERGVDATIVACDVGDREEAQRLIDEAVAKTGQIDVLINNAGIIQVGPREHMRIADFEQAMAVHFWGPLYTTLAALPYMRRRHSGRIVNISSIGGKIGVPHLVPYCASKFALTGLSDAMRGEVARDGIYMTTVCPGLMRTGSPFNAWFKGNHRAEFAWFIVSDSIPGMTVSVEKAAARIIEACRHGDAELIITWPAKMAVLANAVTPEGVAMLMDVANRAPPAAASIAPAADRSLLNCLSPHMPPARHRRWPTPSVRHPRCSSQLPSLYSTNRTGSQDSCLPSFRRCSEVSCTLRRCTVAESFSSARQISLTATSTTVTLSRTSDKFHKEARRWM